MFDEKESRTIAAIDKILSETDLNYYLIIKKAGDFKKENAYYSLNSPLTEEELVFFIDTVIDCLVESLNDFCSEDPRSIEEKEIWVQQICEKVSSNKIQ